MILGQKTEICKLIDPLVSKILSGSPDMPIRAVSTDTRTLKKGDFFIPLEGPNFDGHDFIPEAIKRGCSGFAYDGSKEKKAEGILSISGGKTLKELLVINTGPTIGFLMEMAARYMRLFKTINIGITGSVGKTTTKCMLANILREKRLVYTPKNYNTEIGVSLCMLGIRQDTEFFLAELAMRGKDQIRQLAGMIGLDSGLITSVGPSHLIFFNDEKEIAIAKAEIASGLDANGNLFLRDDDRYSQLIEGIVPNNIKRFGKDKKSFVYFSEPKPDRLGRYSFALNSLEGKITEVSLPIPGMHNVYNACAAAAVAYHYGISKDDIRSGLEGAEIEGSRMCVIQQGKKIIVDDCYNANPMSVKEAINTLSAIRDENKGMRTVAILGDMLELGVSEEALHYDIGQYLRQKGIDALIAFGRLSKNTCKGYKDAKDDKGCHYFKDKNSLSKRLDDLVREGDIVLVKGSRSNKMETIIEQLR